MLLPTWLQALLVTALSALAPIHGVMVAAGVLIVVDLVTGIWAAVKRGEHIKSAALRRTISKIAIYQLTIISGFLVQHYLLTDALPIVKMVAGAIGLTELKSIFENADSINGGSLLKAVLAKLGSDNDHTPIVTTTVQSVQEVPASPDESTLTVSVKAHRSRKKAPKPEGKRPSTHAKPTKRRR